jgi:hypothetical protein
MLRRLIAGFAAWLLWKCIEADAEDAEPDDELCEEPDITFDADGFMLVRRDARPELILSAMLAAQAQSDLEEGYLCQRSEN